MRYDVSRGPIHVSEPRERKPGPNDLRRQTAALAMISQAAWQPIVFVLGGLAFDRWAGTLPWGTVVCAALGLVSTVYTIIRVATPQRKP